MQTAVMSCMRNEAMFVLEWVAYHRAICFDHVFVCTNDCDDGTDLILDRLEALGQVIHIRNDDHGETPPQLAGVSKVLAHPMAQRCRWLLHIDADEFLNVLDGDGRLADWLPRLGDADAVAIAWRLFGDSGLTEWPEGGLQIEILTRAAARQTGFTAMQKTMFDPAAFGAGIDHMPKAPRRDVVRLVNAAGRGLNAAALHEPAQSDHRFAAAGEINRKRHFPWDGAVVNHYAVRTRDLFLMKNHRGDAKGTRFVKRYFLNSRWHRAANANDVEERTILRHLAGTKGLIGEWRRADPRIETLEKEAFAWFAAKRADFLAPDRIAELTNRGAEPDAAVADGPASPLSGESG